jgi:hypothetical protein
MLAEWLVPGLEDSVDRVRANVMMKLTGLD